MHTSWVLLFRGEYGIFKFAGNNLQRQSCQTVRHHDRRLGRGRHVGRRHHRRPIGVA